MVLNQDFREFIELLNERNVKYLVIGGYAVAFHGHPRYTKDIDFWIWLNEENAERMVQVLRDFGFGSLDIKKADFLDKKMVVQLGYPPSRIDLLTDLDELDFKTCYDRRDRLELEGLTVEFIDVDSLIKTKKAAGRMQDLADVEQLENGRGQNL